MSPTPPEDDFPFYDGRPVALSVGQWLLVCSGAAAGFAALVLLGPRSGTSFGQMLPAALFAALPLAALAIATPRHWTALFRRVGVRDVGWMVLTALLTILVTFAVGSVVMKVWGAASNPAFAALRAQGAGDRAWFFLRTLPQLLGEELVTVLPMLALMTLLRHVARLPRAAAIGGAWLLSALIFGALHLPTYDWNVVQCLVVIGSARLVLSLAYLKTKNLWVSTGAHVINDWTLFGLALLFAGAAPSTA